MNFRHLALKNIKGNWRSYKAFLYSSSFSILIFFIYASFIYHPDVSGGELRATVRNGLVACNYIIVGFSALFILYSNSTFLRSRKKELGLLTLLGATKRQIGRMVVLEQLMMGLLSIVFGISLGLVFSKLFFMMMSNLLDVKNPIPFIFNGKAILMTASIYFVLFLVLSLFGLWGIRRLEIIELLRAARKQRVEPFYSKWLFWFGVACIVTGYIIATQVTLVNIMTYFFVVIGLVIVGTYFFFTQGSVAILKMMQGRKKLFYQNPNLFVISNLVYKMKDNARFLFTITILTAIVVSASGTMYTYFSDIKKKVIEATPHTFSYTEKGVNSGEVLPESKVEEIWKKHSFHDVRKTTLVELRAEAQKPNGNRMRISVISENEYNKEARRQGKKQLHNANGTGTIVYPSQFNDFRFFESMLTFFMQEKQYSMKLNAQYSESVFNYDSETDTFFVVNDDEFQKLAPLVPDAEKLMYHGYTVKNWPDTEAVVKELQALIPEGRKHVTSEQIITYNMVKQGGSLTLFIGGFISVLFFLAACSMTYFKWFNDIERDRIQYQSLMRIGMTRKEINKIAMRQMGAVFFVPIVFGIVHSGFALYALSNMLHMNLVETSVIVIGTYIVAAYLYFLFAQREYMKHI
ncbi:FtsX-like permease family protein [Microbacteriaceae bacterium 4G12]